MSYLQHNLIKQKRRNTNSKVKTPVFISKDHFNQSLVNSMSKDQGKISYNSQIEKSRRQQGRSRGRLNNKYTKHTTQSSNNTKNYNNKIMNSVKQFDLQMDGLQFENKNRQNSKLKTWCHIEQNNKQIWSPGQSNLLDVSEFNEKISLINQKNSDSSEYLNKIQNYDFDAKLKQTNKCISSPQIGTIQQLLIQINTQNQIILKSNTTINQLTHSNNYLRQQIIKKQKIIKQYQLSMPYLQNKHLGKTNKSQSMYRINGNKVLDKISIYEINSYVSQYAATTDSVIQVIQSQQEQFILNGNSDKVNFYANQLNKTLQSIPKPNQILLKQFKTSECWQIVYKLKQTIQQYKTYCFKLQCMLSQSINKHFQHFNQINDFEYLQLLPSQLLDVVVKEINKRVQIKTNQLRRSNQQLLDICRQFINWISINLGQQKLKQINRNKQKSVGTEINYKQA